MSEKKKIAVDILLIISANVKIGAWERREKEEREE